MSDNIVNSKVNVFVRCRPLSGKEICGKKCININPKDTIQIGEKKFSFESIFDENTTQSIIYDKCVKSLVVGCFKGYNATVFAYGQTGSGKTHSIMGAMSNSSDGIDDEEIGIIPRAIKDIFQTLHNAKSNGNMSNIRVSMIEIYNDDCKDLLHPDISSRDIMIREDLDGRIFFTGAREEVVPDVCTALYFLEQGNLNRSTAETLMNLTSSRSHAIFTISIEVLDYSNITTTTTTESNKKYISKSTNNTTKHNNNKHTNDNNSDDIVDTSNATATAAYIQAKLHLVDLAGSERIKRTGALGARLKESVGINQGLLSLGKVIRALTATATTSNSNNTNNNIPIKVHIPYRESKLTRFLQDSLGGNSRTVMLACISSAECNLHETLGTLQYAYRAKAVQNKISANIAVGLPLLHTQVGNIAVGGTEFQAEMESTLVIALKTQIEKMQIEMQQLQHNPQLPINHNNNNNNNNNNIMSLVPRIPMVETKDNNDSKIIQEYKQYLQGLIRTLSRIRNSISEHIQHIQSIHKYNSVDCGAAWNLVNVSQAVIQTIDELITQSQRILSSTTTNNSSYNNNIMLSNQGMTSYINQSINNRNSLASLRQSLSDSLYHLQPPHISNPNAYANTNTNTNNTTANRNAIQLSSQEDELIQLRQELEECREDLKRDEDIFSEKIKDLKHCRKRIKELENNNKLLENKNIEFKQNIHKLVMKLQPNYKRINHTSTDNSSDLDISIAVAITEPDISQLMEDLEVLVKEKEVLEAKHQQHMSQIPMEDHDEELKYKEIEQQNEFNEKKINDLDSIIIQKQDIILELSDINYQLEQVLNDYKYKNKQLNEENQQLKLQFYNNNDEDQQIKLLEKHIQTLELNFQNERNELNEKYLKDKQHLEEQQAIKLKNELTIYRKEYEKLNKQIEYNENKQRKTLETLSHQITMYKKKLIEITDNYKLAEERNIDLRNRLDRYKSTKQNNNNINGYYSNDDNDNNKVSMIQNPEPIADEKDSTIYNNNTSNNSNNKNKNTNDNKSSLVNAINIGSEGTQWLLQQINHAGMKMKDWLLHQINEIVEVKSVQSEYQRLQERNIHLKEEQMNLKLEIKKIINNDNINNNIINQSHYIDNNNSFIENDINHQVQDLIDELETIETEIELNEARIAHEKLRLTRNNSYNIINNNNNNSNNSNVNKNDSKENQFQEQNQENLYYDIIIKNLKHEFKNLSINKTNEVSENKSIPLLDMKVNSALVKVFISMLITEKTNTSKNLNTIKLVQQQLEDKTTEYDEVIKVMQKSRTEFARRMEQSRNEANEKIAFLLQQLRTVESHRRKLQEEGANSSTASTPYSDRSKFNNINSISYSKNKLMKTSDLTFTELLKLENKSHINNSINLNSINNNSNITTTNNNNDDINMNDINKELERRWNSEKERREQLEKRNFEMLKEIKNYKEILKQYK